MAESFSVVQGSVNCGHVVTLDKNVLTGTMSGIEYLILRIKNKKTGMYSLRYFPHRDRDDFFDKGLWFNPRMHAREVQIRLGHFSDVQALPFARLNPMHLVRNWANLYVLGGPETPIFRGDDSGKYFQVLELWVPATGWIFKWETPKSETLEHLAEKTRNRFRVHFNGCFYRFNDTDSECPHKGKVPWHLAEGYSPSLHEQDPSDPGPLTDAEDPDDEGMKEALFS